MTHMSLLFQSLRGGPNKHNQLPSASVPSSSSNSNSNSRRCKTRSPKRRNTSRNLKRLAYLPVLQLLLLPILILSLQTKTVSAQVDVGGFVDPVFCLDALYESDALENGGDENGVIDRNEYVTFAKLQGPSGFLDGIDAYANLPTAFKLAFTSLACLCDNPEFGGNETDPGCCLGVSAGIRIPVDAIGSDTDALYLYVICARTDAATEIVLGSPAPSMEPTPAPTLRPTLAPTRAPTLAPTLAPTRLPTLAPTPGPTFAPTLAPTMAPTLRPTAQPTFRPTVQPTQRPSEAPIVPGDPTRAPVTGTPSVRPTAQPTARPTTQSPTRLPTVGPTFQPNTEAPTGAPNTEVPSGTPNAAAPTGSPTASPPLQSLATVVYQIAVVPDTAEADYLSDLQVAMNDLAFQVGMETFPAAAGGGRRLQVMVQLPTGFGLVEDIDCAVNFGRVTDENDLCQDVSSEIMMTLTGEDRTREVQNVDTYESNLFQAIFSGRLQEVMDELFPGAPVSILTGTGVTPDKPETGDDNLSPGATAGITMAILVLALVPLTVFLIRRQRVPPEHKVDYEPYEADAENDMSVLNKESSLSVYTDDALGETATVGAAATLGASQADYGKAKVSRSAFEAMEAGEDLVAEPGMDVAPDSSSNAGSSGWSSSAGISSLNTGSMDESADMAAAAGIGMGLAAIGATSALSRKIDSDKRGEDADDVLIVQDVSRDQLDNLIESGDWAAVGATAALLAAASDSQSASTRSRGTSRSSSRESSVDAARASELDHLVDAGDWEGVVLAAAKFEASEAGRSDKSGTNSSVGSAGSAGSDSGTGTGTLGTGGSPSESNISENPSMAAKRAELRGEVEALVRRVVPEEIDNVDEMMNQFKGREEELVETLRTMQERAVAQKARTAGHKAAKTEARRSVQRGVVPGATATTQPPPPQTAATLIAGLAAVSADGADGTFEDSSSNLTGGSGTEASAAQHRSALEMAIESGDWEAVGQAAAMMSDASVGTASTGTDPNVSRTSSGTSRSRSQGSTANRAAELDELIDQGDWSGVVAAAAQFKQDDTKPKAKTNVSKEEEDALAEAELWTKIAEEKKKGATDAGASDAAEWAISRSLSQMKEKEAEQQQQKDDDENDDDDEEDEV